MCNPIKVFSCIVKSANQKPKIKVEHYVKPQIDRIKVASELMPIEILTKEELEIISANTNIEMKDIKQKQPFISEELRTLLPLRDTDKISEAKQPYQRN